MNTMVLKLISSLGNQKTADQKGLEPAQKGENLFADILKSLNAAPNKSAHKSKSMLKKDVLLNNDRYQAHLKSLRKALLANGKPLNKAALKDEDLVLIDKFLRQCGFSQKKVNQFLEELAEKSIGGHIKLSHFFPKSRGAFRFQK